MPTTLISEAFVSCKELYLLARVGMNNHQKYILVVNAERYIQQGWLREEESSNKHQYLREQKVLDLLELFYKNNPNISRMVLLPEERN